MWYKAYNVRGWKSEVSVNLEGNVSVMADGKLNLEILDNLSALSVRCLDFFIERVNQVLDKNEQFMVAISGGHTPECFYELLGHSPKALALRWERIHLFWVDERCVPSDSTSSNYKLALDTFLTKVSIPAKNIHRIEAEKDDVTASARAYEKEMQKVFGIGAGEVPSFDLIILGMGAEGHMASLFPNSSASFDERDLASVVYELDNDYSRITLTHPIFRAASDILILVSGAEKAGILKEVFTNEPDEVRYPVHLLWPILDRVTWLIDKDAARLL